MNSTTTTQTQDKAMAGTVADIQPLPPIVSPLQAVLSETERRIEEFKYALEPAEFKDAWTQAQVVAKAGICGVKTPEEAYARILTGRSLGWGVMTSMRNVYLIEGTPCVSAKGKVGLLKSRRDVIEWFVLVESTMEKATYRAKRKGEPEIVHSYTIEMAERAQLLNRGKDEAAKKMNNWNRFTAEMLRARASGQLADIVAPDLTNGMPTVEEVQDEADLRAATDEFLAKPKAAPEQPPQSQPLRDFAAEGEALKVKIAAAKTPEDRKAVRAELEAWSKDAGPLAAEVKRFYNATQTPVTPAATPAPAKTREPGED